MRFRGSLEVPMLVTGYKLEQPIIGYVIEEVIREKGLTTDLEGIVSLLSGSFHQKSHTDLMTLVKAINSSIEETTSIVKLFKRDVAQVSIMSAQQLAGCKIQEKSDQGK